MKNKTIILLILTAFIFGVCGYFTGIHFGKEESENKCVEEKTEEKDEVKQNKKENKKEEKNKNKKDLIGKSFIRTYNINHIAPSNDFDYLYITIRMFQDEEIETVKVKRSLFENAKAGDNYEIEFVVTNNDIKENIKSIFENSEIISVEKTDKTGLNQIIEFAE